MDTHPLHRHALRSLFTNTGARTRRSSSWDRSGRNRDFVFVGPGETVTLLEHDGPGCVTHLYCALAFPEITDYRDAVLRCSWDGEATPSRPPLALAQRIALEQGRPSRAWGGRLATAPQARARNALQRLNLSSRFTMRECCGP